MSPIYKRTVLNPSDALPYKAQLIYSSQRYINKTGVNHFEMIDTRLICGSSNHHKWGQQTKIHGLLPRQTAPVQRGEHNPLLVKQMRHVLPDDLNQSNAPKPSILMVVSTHFCVGTFVRLRFCSTVCSTASRKAAGWSMWSPCPALATT
jgi:hypothetical protein